MAGGVDTTKWKPRQLRNTPAQKFGLKFCWAFLLSGITIGVVYNSLPFLKPFKEQYKIFSTLTDEELDRKALITFLPQKSGDDIRKIREETKEMNTLR